MGEGVNKQMTKVSKNQRLRSHPADAYGKITALLTRGTSQVPAYEASRPTVT